MGLPLFVVPKNVDSSSNNTTRSDANENSGRVNQPTERPSEHAQPRQMALPPVNNPREVVEPPGFATLRNGNHFPVAPHNPSRGPLPRMNAQQLPRLHYPQSMQWRQQESAYSAEHTDQVMRATTTNGFRNTVLPPPLSEDNYRATRMQVSPGWGPASTFQLPSIIQASRYQSSSQIPQTDISEYTSRALFPGYSRSGGGERSPAEPNTSRVSTTPSLANLAYRPDLRFPPYLPQPSDNNQSMPSLNSNTSRSLLQPVHATNRNRMSFSELDRRPNHSIDIDTFYERDEARRIINPRFQRYESEDPYLTEVQARSRIYDVAASIVLNMDNIYFIGFPPF